MEIFYEVLEWSFVSDDKLKSQFHTKLFGCSCLSSVHFRGEHWSYANNCVFALCRVYYLHVILILFKNQDFVVTTSSQVMETALHDHLTLAYQLAFRVTCGFPATTICNDRAFVGRLCRTISSSLLERITIFWISSSKDGRSCLMILFFKKDQEDSINIPKENQIYFIYLLVSSSSPSERIFVASSSSSGS